MTTWLEELKTGDRVFIRYGYGVHLFDAEVTRTTKTQVTARICGSDTESTYMKKSGRRKGSAHNNFSMTRLEQVTPVTIAEYEAEKIHKRKEMLAQDLMRLDWRLFSEDDLRDLESLIDRVTDKRK